MFSTENKYDYHINDGDLTKIVQSLFVKLGCPVDDALVISEHLVTANLYGHDSHGVSLIPLYTRMIREEKINPVSKIELKEVSQSVLIVDANKSMGQVAATKAMEYAIKAASKTGMALVSLKDSHHIGRIGHYAEQCARAGYVSMHFVNVVHAPPVVAPYGGSEPRLHTNPISIGIPRNTDLPIVLDFATSRVAQGKMRIAMARGIEIPKGYLVDSNGIPTTDPAAAYGTPETPMGALLPFGEYKGFGLGLMCDLLAGAIAGDCSLHEGTIEQDVYINNMFSLVFDPSIFGDKSRQNLEIEKVLGYIKSSKGSENGPIRFPGEGSMHRMRKRKIEGIPVDKETWHVILAILNEYYVQHPSIKSVNDIDTA